MNRPSDRHARSRGKRLWPTLRPPRLCFDPPDLCSLSQPGFEHVVHVCPAEWQGMVSAASYAPGHTLLFDSRRSVRSGELKQIESACANWRLETAVFHSLAPTTEPLVRAFRALGVRCLGVWHGSTAQLHIPSEYQALEAFVALRRQGVFHAIAAVKPGLHLAIDAFEAQPWLNFLPNIAQRAPRPPQRAALLACDDSWVKNFQTNLFAAAAESRLERIHVAPGRAAGSLLDHASKVVVHAFLTRGELFELMREVDVVLNASLSECQPMVMLEALALGVPCLVPVLGLDVLDAHPYGALTQVAGADSVAHVRAKLSRLLDLAARGHELAEMIADFAARWNALAIERFASFVDTDRSIR